MFYKKCKNVGKKVLNNKFNLDMTIKTIKLLGALLVCILETLNNNACKMMKIKKMID